MRHHRSWLLGPTEEAVEAAQAPWGELPCRLLAGGGWLGWACASCYKSAGRTRASPPGTTPAVCQAPPLHQAPAAATLWLLREPLAPGQPPPPPSQPPSPLAPPPTTTTTTHNPSCSAPPPTSPPATTRHHHHPHPPQLGTLLVPSSVFSTLSSLASCESSIISTTASANDCSGRGGGAEAGARWAGGSGPRRCSAQPPGGPRRAGCGAGRPPGEQGFQQESPLACGSSGTTIFRFRVLRRTPLRAGERGAGWGCGPGRAGRPRWHAGPAPTLTQAGASPPFDCGQGQRQALISERSGGVGAAQGPISSHAKVLAPHFPIK